jgi:VanZ family protein
MPVNGTQSEARQSPIALAGLWLPVIVYMAAIFVASAIPEPPIPSGVSDVSLHEAAYFGLTLLLIRALARGSWVGVSAGALAAAWALAVAYGVSDEWHQSFVPGRFAELRDLGSDAIGAAIAVAVVGAWGIIRRL